MCVCVIIPASVSVKLKFCVAFGVDYKATAAGSSVECVEYDHIETEWSYGLVLCCVCPVHMSDGMSGMV